MSPKNCHLNVKFKAGLNVLLMLAKQGPRWMYPVKSLHMGCSLPENISCLSGGRVSFDREGCLVRALWLPLLLSLICRHFLASLPSFFSSVGLDVLTDGPRKSGLGVGRVEGLQGEEGKGGTGKLLSDTKCFFLWVKDTRLILRLKVG